jgi:hypothetical protein
MPIPENNPAMAVVQRGPYLSRNMPPGSMPTDWKMMNIVNINATCSGDQP